MHCIVIFFNICRRFCDPMALFPLPRRIRSFQGPHCDCVDTAETHLCKFKKDKARDHIFDHLLRTTIIAIHLRFTFYFTLGLLSMLGLLLSAVGFFIGYCFTRLMLRFQFKINIVLVLMQQPHLNCHTFNKLCIYILHILMLFIGGFGWVSLLYIEV